VLVKSGRDSYDVNKRETYKEPRALGGTGREFSLINGKKSMSVRMASKNPKEVGAKGEDSDYLITQLGPGGEAVCSSRRKRSVAGLETLTGECARAPSGRQGNGPSSVKVLGDELKCAR